MLLSIPPGAFFAYGWLVVKLILVVVYICLASLALRSPSSVRRRWAFVAALVVFRYIISIARAHHPLGVFLSWLL